MDRNCQVSHYLYLSASYQKSPPTDPSSLLPEVMLRETHAEEIGTCAQERALWGLTTADHLPSTCLIQLVSLIYSP